MALGSGEAQQQRRGAGRRGVWELERGGYGSLFVLDTVASESDPSQRPGTILPPRWDGKILVSQACTG